MDNNHDSIAEDAVMTEQNAQEEPIFTPQGEIINGEEYRKKAKTRMLRTANIEATRGEITDRNGVVLATSKVSYNLVMYKVNIEPAKQNDSIATVIKILDKNSDNIYIQNSKGIKYSSLNSEFDYSQIVIEPNTSQKFSVKFNKSDFRA